MSLTPGLTLLGLVLLLFAIPLGLALAPLVIGAIVLAYAARAAHVGLADGEWIGRGAPTLAGSDRVG
jgi:hypothetical protein